MSYKTDYNKEERDRAVYSLLPEYPETGIAIEKLVRVNGIRHGTIRASLGRLLDKNKIARKWDGNGRYGRFVYSKSEEASSQD